MAGKSLFERMKSYEKCYDIKVPNRSYVVIRLDGKGFSKFTKGFEKPFDAAFSNCMDVATIKLCEYLNPKFAYTQSDEISLVFTNIENIESELIFDGKVQKLASIAASKLTAEFNLAMLRTVCLLKYDVDELIYKLQVNELSEIKAVFDARVFVIPDFREVSNYFIHRQQDCTRNSISMAADAHYSTNELEGKSGSIKQDMLMEKGVNWNDYPVKFKRGIVVKRHIVMAEGPAGEPVERNRWLPDYKTPIFTQETEYLYNLIPTVL